MKCILILSIAKSARKKWVIPIDCSYEGIKHQFRYDPFSNMEYSTGYEEDKFLNHADNFFSESTKLVDNANNLKKYNKINDTNSSNLLSTNRESNYKINKTTLGQFSVLYTTIRNKNYLINSNYESDLKTKLPTCIHKVYVC